MATRSSGLSADIVDAFHRMALRYYSRQLYTESERLLTYILRHEPANPQFRYAHGKALHALGRHGAAQAAYGLAIQWGLDEVRVHFYRAQCLIYLREFESAAQSLDRFLRLVRTQSPSHPALRDQAEHLMERLQMLQKKYGPRPGGPTGDAVGATGRRPVGGRPAGLTAAAS